MPHAEGAMTSCATYIIHLINSQKASKGKLLLTLIMCYSTACMCLHLKINVVRCGQLQVHVVLILDSLRIKRNQHYLS